MSILDNNSFAKLAAENQQTRYRACPGNADDILLAEVHDLRDILAKCLLDLKTAGLDGVQIKASNDVEDIIATIAEYYLGTLDDIRDFPANIEERDRKLAEMRAEDEADLRREERILEGRR